MADQLTATPAPAASPLPAKDDYLAALLNPFVTVLVYLGEIVLLLWQAVKSLRAG